MNADAILAFAQELKLAGLAEQFPADNRPSTHGVCKVRYAGKWGILKNPAKYQYATLVTPVYVRDGIDHVDVYYGGMGRTGDSTFEASSTHRQSAYIFPLVPCFSPSPHDWNRMTNFFLTGLSMWKGVSLPGRESVFSKPVEVENATDREYHFFATSRHNVATRTGLDRHIAKYVNMEPSKRVSAFITTMVGLVSDNVLNFHEEKNSCVWTFNFRYPLFGCVFVPMGRRWFTTRPAVMGRLEWIAKTDSKKGTVVIDGKEHKVDLSK